MEKKTGEYVVAFAREPDQAPLGQNFQMPFPGMNQMQMQGMMPTQYPYPGQLPQVLMQGQQGVAAGGAATETTEGTAGQ